MSTNCLRVCFMCVSDDILKVVSLEQRERERAPKLRPRLPTSSPSSRAHQANRSLIANVQTFVDEKSDWVWRIVCGTVVLLVRCSISTAFISTTSLSLFRLESSVIFCPNILSVVVVVVVRLPVPLNYIFPLSSLLSSFGHDTFRNI